MNPKLEEWRKLAEEIEDHRHETERKDAVAMIRQGADEIEWLQSRLASAIWDLEELEGQAIAHPDSLSIDWVRRYSRAAINRLKAKP